MSQNKQLELQVMALAGIEQAIALVQQVAQTGSCDSQALQACLHSVLVTDPKHPAEVFNYTPKSDNEQDNVIEISGNYKTILETGYKLIAKQLGNQQDKDMQITRYTIGLFALERKLAKRRDLLSMMGERIGQVKRQLHHFNINDDPVVANLASIYSDIISPIGPRIQISGDSNHLQQPNVQNKIRALLLAAMRACVLWRQLGGKRRQLIFNRKQILQQAKH